MPTIQCSTRDNKMGFRKFQFQNLFLSLDHFNPLHFCLLLISFFALYIKLVRGKSKEPKLNLPPSPPRLPIIGNLHQLSFLAHQSLTSLSRKYGPLMLLKVGQTNIAVVSSADMAKEVMKTHDTAFSNRTQTTAARIFGYDGKDVGLSPYGDYWRHVRRISVHELLSVKRVELFQDVRDDEVRVLLNSIKAANGESFNLTELLIIAANNVVSRCIFGKKFDEGNGNSKYGALARVMQIQLLAFSFADFFPSFGWIDDVRGFMGELKNTHDGFDALFDQLIEEHKKKKKSSENEKDFMDILLELQNEGDLDFEFKNDNIKAVLTDLYLAGSDTSATTIEWTMAELIRNPSKMKKVQEEVRRVLGKKTKIDPNDVNAMTYLDAVLKEALRLHPSGPPLIPRETSATIKNMGGYDLPANTTVYVNVYGIQRDPEVWENPIEYIPERFIENPIDYKSTDTFKFLPFGGGRRGCPGTIFAMTSIKYFMAHLLYWFDWKLADETLIPEELEMEETNGIIVPKKNPLHLKAKLYSP